MFDNGDVPSVFLVCHMWQDLGLGERLLVCVSALKPEDCMGAHCEIATTYRGALDCFTKLGFYRIPLQGHRARDTVISGRTS